MNSASDTTDKDEPVPKWDDPDKVPWHFLKTGKSKVKGILVTHNSNFKVAVEYVKIFPLSIFVHTSPLKSFQRSMVVTMSNVKVTTNDNGLRIKVKGYFRNTDQ